VPLTPDRLDENTGYFHRTIEYLPRCEQYGLWQKAEEEKDRQPQAEEEKKAEPPQEKVSNPGRPGGPVVARRALPSPPAEGAGVAPPGIPGEAAGDRQYYSRAGLFLLITFPPFHILLPL